MKIDDIEIVKSIFTCVLNTFNTSEEGLKSRSREAKYNEPRQVLFALCYSFTDLSLGEVGAMFGKRDHATVIHAINKVKDHYETDKKFAKAVESIISFVNLELNSVFTFEMVQNKELGKKKTIYLSENPIAHVNAIIKKIIEETDTEEILQLVAKLKAANGKIWDATVGKSFEVETNLTIHNNIATLHDIKNFTYEIKQTQSH